MGIEKFSFGGEETTNVLPLPEPGRLVKIIPEDQIEYIAHKIKVRYHKELYPDLMPIEVINKGDWIDLRAAQSICLRAGEYKIIPLGVSIELPVGYSAIVSPRSSTFKKYGILMSNSIGVIDESYKGDNDIWGFPAYATKDITIPVNERICQFTIIRKPIIEIEEVESLDNNEDRGGFGSTGKV